jgi:exopolysaccharide biosynthesis protein
VAVIAAFSVLPFTIAVTKANVALAASDTTNVGGLTLRTFSGVPYGVTTSIHELTLSGAQYSLAIDLANHEVDGGLETPSSMCRSTPDCVAAVNADFFDATPHGQTDPGDEVGGIIQNCVLLHTPELSHQQVDLDGPSVSGALNWSSTVDVNGVTVPITAINQELPMKYQGVNLPLTGTLLFTAPYTLPTPSAAGRMTYEFAQVDAMTNPATSPTTINTTAELDLVAETTQPVKVAVGDVDISAPTGSAFATLPLGTTVPLTTTSNAGCNNIGGHPILLDDGVVVPTSPADTYLAQRYARSVIGWTTSGETVIVTVGGIDDRTGATASQLDRLLLSLNVVTALDLDGGDSTALYANGRIFYHANKAGERPVSTALLVIQNP